MGEGFLLNRGKDIQGGKKAFTESMFHTLSKKERGVQVKTCEYQSPGMSMLTEKYLLSFLMP